MKKKQTFEKRYLKYVVKSPVLFCTYMVLFVIVFICMTTRLKLDVRKSFEGEIYGDEIIVAGEIKSHVLEDKVYVYKNKNQKIFVFDIETIEYSTDEMHIFLNEEQDELFGEITLEVIDKRNSLFETIFTKAGVNR